MHMHKITKKEKRLVDRAAYVVSLLFPVFTIPQVIMLYSTKDSSGISLVTWLAYLVLSILFLIFVLVDKIRPLILAQIAWIFIEIAMIIGILIY